MQRFLITPDLITGVDDIDGHHRALFEIADKVVNVPLDGNSLPAFQEGLSFFNGYVLYHFAAEEHVMKRVSYPRFEQHRQWHSRFRDEIRGIMERAAQNGIFNDLTARISLVMESWLKEHIRVMDRDMASFIRGLGDASALNLPAPERLRDSGALPADFDTEVTVIYEREFEPGGMKLLHKPSKPGLK
jgi:hemerythrin